MDHNELSEKIIGAAIEVHKNLGPGLLESVYEQCLALELARRSLPVERQKEVPLSYKGVNLEHGFRMDLVVGNMIVVELKTVDALLPIHMAQLMTNLKLSDMRLGLLINFNVTRLVHGIKRVANEL